MELFKRRFPHYELVAHPERGTVLFQHDEKTTYSPEELIAMILQVGRIILNTPCQGNPGFVHATYGSYFYHLSLQHAAKIAEDFSEQKVQDAVVTVPVYFNQVRRLSQSSFMKSKIQVNVEFCDSN